MPHTALRDSLDLLRTRRFGTFWFASLLSSIGTWAQQVAQPWLLLSLGASPFLVGLDAFALSAPVWALTLLGGQLADRADRTLKIGVVCSLHDVCVVSFGTSNKSGASPLAQRANSRKYRQPEEDVMFDKYRAAAITQSHSVTGFSMPNNLLVMTLSKEAAPHAHTVVKGSSRASSSSAGISGWRWGCHT